MFLLVLLSFAIRMEQVLGKTSYGLQPETPEDHHGCNLVEPGAIDRPEICDPANCGRVHAGHQL